MAAAALHPCVGHVYADAVAITAFNPRTAAERHLHMALLSASGIDDPQIAGWTSAEEIARKSPVRP